MYVVNNGLADACTVKVSGQTGIAVPAGKTMLLFNNGTDVLDAVTHLSSLTLATDLAIADGGTGASSAAAARTNLGLVINTDVQSFSAVTAAISALPVNNGNFIVGNGSTFVAEADATARTSLGLGTIATQAANSVTITGGTMSGVTVNTFVVGSNAVGTRTLSSSDASGGSNGDIHYKF